MNTLSKHLGTIAPTTSAIILVLQKVNAFLREISYGLMDAAFGRMILMRGNHLVLPQVVFRHTVLR